MIVTVDGGPDENPRYTKTIECAIDYFLSQELDALFLATNAPSRSAFNRVEHQMVKFSKELSGVVLPHDKFGSHLNVKRETIDKELGKKKNGYAGEIPAKFWSSMIICSHPVLAEFIIEEADQELRNLKNGRVNTFANHNIFCKSLSARIQNAAVHFIRAI